MAAALPRARVVHALPGRTRLRIEEKRGDAAYFASLSAALATLPGVEQVSAAALTGSLVVRHEPPLEAIAATARAAGLFVVDAASAGATVPVPDSPAAGAGLAARPLLVAGLVGAAVWQFSRARLFPPAITLLWYALHVGRIGPFDADEG